ncbi:carboxymuconolactone decarboxylase family protein [Thermomonospora catenispora]|uniref:carboxymuconolactone decarboxylase family protein n=1 Tax=Thermomonospora catenispora TaxID=2493090 RepID=UPI0011228536|nr:carboxymuconolactone decarboxylase family protein [Thermomonospora catenispora]TNY36889.1 carboxymuconolactone decarboxylase family protein [Thermomonospora catenispora]
MPRLDLMAAAAGPYKAFLQANAAIAEGPLDHRLWKLVELRVSQLNGCVFCIDMHSHDALEHGEEIDRLLQVAAWRESELFTEAERAALGYAEAATRLGGHGVPDEVWDAVTEHFSPEEAGHLVAAVALINAFNRIAVPLQKKPPRR